MRTLLAILLFPLLVQAAGEGMWQASSVAVSGDYETTQKYIDYVHSLPGMEMCIRDRARAFDDVMDCYDVFCWNGDWSGLLWGSRAFESLCYLDAHCRNRQLSLIHIYTTFKIECLYLLLFYIRLIL